VGYDEYVGPARDGANGLERAVISLDDSPGVFLSTYQRRLGHKLSDSVAVHISVIFTRD
jgi:hypothetical protein